MVFMIKYTGTNTSLLWSVIQVVTLTKIGPDDLLIFENIANLG